jgi:hypothetical protein
LSFAGNLRTVALPDIFQLIFSSKKTGVLKVTNGNSIRQIYFREGSLIHASSNDEQDLFGNMLLKKGRISKEELNRVLVSQKEGRKIGALLVDKKLFTREEIFECLKMQIEEIVFGLFGWKESDFEFIEGQSPPEGSIQTELNPMNLIMEGTRRIDEWEELKRVLPPDESVIELVRDPSIKSEELRLSKNEIIVMAVIGSGKTMSRIIEECYLDRFLTSKALANLLQMKLIVPIKKTEKEEGREQEQKTLTEVLAQIYMRNLGYIFENLRQKLGDKGERVITQTFEQNKSLYPLLSSGFTKGEIDFDFFVKLYEQLPEEAKIWKIVSNFNSLMNDYLDAVKDSLGSKVYRRLLSEIRINIQNAINRNRQLSMKYGLQEEFSRALRDR